ncbi:DegV family protein [Agathobaculum sp. NTUH-O15-33]|uniref:DegV family protein n=1 Tax=Agathobaculum sp. NTUH-O15-33 TaxID=3079302 RepID=UPI002958DAF2|nr:DegV family protein [Agathobaculum sp. NTUH-O15-33]WNX86533.1 DegV family protein [Agathobaculum sp. NTUH-O15-33]
MPDYMITCCSTADLSADYFREKGVPYACFHFHLEGKDYQDDLGQSISFPDYYAAIAAGAMPTTSQVNTEEYEALFEPLLKRGKDILHLTLSSGLSGTYTSACIARDELNERYPERRIYVVDTLGASSGYGLLVDTACEKRDAGMPIDELYNWLEQNKLRLHHWFFSTDLTSYKRGGRISPTAATFGTLLGICPLLNMDREGHLIPRKKIRGKKQVVREIVRMMEEHAENGLGYSGKCFISESACMEDARAVADQVQAQFPNLNGKVCINSIGTVIGAHTGPGTVALFFWGDERFD